MNQYPQTRRAFRPKNGKNFVFKDKKNARLARDSFFIEIEVTKDDEDSPWYESNSGQLPEENVVGAGDTPSQPVQFNDTNRNNPPVPVEVTDPALVAGSPAAVAAAQATAEADAKVDTANANAQAARGEGSGEELTEAELEAATKPSEDVL